MSWKDSIHGLLSSLVQNRIGTDSTPQQLRASARARSRDHLWTTYGLQRGQLPELRLDRQTGMPLLVEAATAPMAGQRVTASIFLPLRGL